MFMCVCHDSCKEVKGQPGEVGSLLPICESWDLNSGYQAWQQVPLKPYCWLQLTQF